jgi:Amt family ammonium transporter
MPVSDSLFDPPNQAVCLLFILLIPFAGAGLALINTGLNRSHSAAHAILSSMIISAVAMITYTAVGFAVQGIFGQAGHSITIGPSHWDWLGAGSFFLAGIGLDGRPASLAAIFGLFSVALASIIPAASLGERWRFGASTASTVLLAGWTYPLFAHWSWGNGWLKQLSVQFGLAGFLDVGGSSCIHAVGGLTALALAWIVGPRRNRFTTEGIPTAMPGHNAVIVVFGSILAWTGFMGLNSAGAVLFSGLTPAQALVVAVNTALSASAAALSAFVTTRVRFGRPDASLTANGWVSGLVAISAGCCFSKPAEAILIGFIAGLLVIFVIEILELRMKIDDPTGAVAVHAGAGIWGILAAGIFARMPGIDASAQFLAQLIGIASLLGLILPLSYGLNIALNYVLPQRVSSESERQGTDLFELGAGAYPEFVTHREDWMRH